MKIRIYVGKNKDKVAGDKRPDLRVAIMKTKEDGKVEFIECGGLWKSQTSSGYSGEIDTEAVPYKKKEVAKEIEPEDIPF